MDFFSLVSTLLIGTHIYFEIKGAILNLLKISIFPKSNEIVEFYYFFENIKIT